MGSNYHIFVRHWIGGSLCLVLNIFIHKKITIHFFSAPDKQNYDYGKFWYIFLLLLNIIINLWIKFVRDHPFFKNQNK